MSRYLNNLIRLSIALGLFLGCNGCAYLTAQRVGTFVAEQAGKKAIEKVKDDKEKKDAEKKQEQRDTSSRPAN